MIDILMSKSSCIVEVKGTIYGKGKNTHRSRDSEGASWVYFGFWCLRTWVCSNHSLTLLRCQW
jgi:hypothetical protein